MQQSFLLSHACIIPKRPRKAWEYSDSLQMNIIQNKEGENAPACSYSSIITGSKTFSAPSDDDPDDEAELCY